MVDRGARLCKEIKKIDRVFFQWDASKFDSFAREKYTGLLNMVCAHFLVLVIFVFWFNKAIDAACIEDTTFESNLHKNTKLWGHVLRKERVVSPIHCADKCLRDVKCKSFNFFWGQSEEGTYLCEINDVKWTRNSAAGITSDLIGTDLYNAGSQDLHKVC